MELSLFLNELYLSYGICQYVHWDTAKAPHIVIFGATGSGKTYATKLLLGRVAKHCPTANLFVCDFKGDDDFAFLEGTDHFYRFLDCEKGLSDFYDRFEQRQSGKDEERSFLLLFIDEWASYILNLDKKKAEEEKKKLAMLLMLGRSFNVHVLIQPATC